MAAEKTLIDRWDMHSNRQIAAAKGGALAITLLNSGSWLALLSQVGSLKGYDTAWAVLAWGTGALLGSMIWLFIYRGTALQAEHDFDKENESKLKSLENNAKFGFSVAIASLVCFAAGVLMLTGALMQ